MTVEMVLNRMAGSVIEMNRQVSTHYHCDYYRDDYVESFDVDGVGMGKMGSIVGVLG